MGGVKASRSGACTSKKGRGAGTDVALKTTRAPPSLSALSCRQLPRMHPFRKKVGLWMAKFIDRGVNINLGIYDTAEEAALAWDACVPPLTNIAPRAFGSRPGAAP